ncbi:MAG: DNRLRE domain-containing protein [Clostridium sp.]
MGSILKFNSVSATYVDSSHANNNFYGSKNIYAGSYHKTSCSTVMFKSLIQFDLDTIEDRPLSYVYLCLYVNDINTDTSYYSNNTFSVYRNIQDYDPKSVTWNTTPETDSLVTVSIPSNEIKNYMRINITSIVNSWLKDNKINFGITIEANNFYSSLAKFASVDSANPPLLFVEYKNPKFDYNLYNEYKSQSFR